MPIARRLKLDLSLFPSPVRARWFDPTTGAYSDAAKEPLPNRQSDDWFLPPSREQDSDWALLLEATGPAAGQVASGDARYYELRIHHALPGKSGAILELLRDKMMELARRHGLNPVACWTDAGAQGGEQVIELFAPAGAEAAERGWRGLYDDPEFKSAFAASEARHGKSTERLEIIRLKAPGSAIKLAANPARRQRVFELRFYQRAPGKEEDFKARWRNHAARIYQRHRAESLGWWEAFDDDHRGVFVALLAHESRAAMQMTLREFLEDGGWTRIEKETELNGRLHTSVTTWLLKASDFSPLK